MHGNSFNMSTTRIKGLSTALEKILEKTILNNPRMDTLVCGATASDVNQVDPSGFGPILLGLRVNQVRASDTLAFCTILRPLFGPFLMSNSHYMSIICIFYLFWYSDVFCEKCAYLSRKRESKCKVW